VVDEGGNMLSMGADGPLEWVRREVAHRRCRKLVRGGALEQSEAAAGRVNRGTGPHAAPEVSLHSAEGHQYTGKKSASGTPATHRAQHRVPRLQHCKPSYSRQGTQSHLSWL